MLKKIILYWLGLFSLGAVGAGETKRLEVPIVDGHLDTFLTPPAETSEISITNEFGSLVVVVKDIPPDRFRFIGKYESESSLPAALQVIQRPGGRHEIVLDGPAHFKSHEHTTGYGRELDRDFFRGAVGRIPSVVPGTTEGEIVVGGALHIFPDSVRIEPGGSARISNWGGATVLGKNFTLGDGVRIGRVSAEAKLYVEVPFRLITSLKLKARATDAVNQVTFEPATLASSFRIEEQDNERVLTLQNCRGALAP